MSTKSPDQVKREFAMRGVSISEWARRNGFSSSLVYEVLKGRPAMRGQSHEIAVALRLKEGIAGGVSSLEQYLEMEKTTNR